MRHSVIGNTLRGTLPVTNASTKRLDWARRLVQLLSDILTICDEDTADYYCVKCPLCGHLTRMKEVDIPPFTRVKCFS